MDETNFNNAENNTTEIQELLNKVAGLEKTVNNLIQEKEALLAKNNELLNEKKKIRDKYTQTANQDLEKEDRIKNLELMLSQLKESYEEEKSKAQEKEKKLKEQTVVSTVVNAFQGLCHDASDFAEYLKYKGLATLNEQGEPVILWQGKEMKADEFREVAVREAKFQHHFKPVAIGGTGLNFSSGNSFNGGSSNPFKTGNLTEQMKIIKENPQLANRLKLEAQSVKK